MNVKTPKSIIVVMTLLVMILLLGEWYAYVAPHNNSSNANISENTITYELSVKGSREYEAVLFDNGDYVPVTKTYLLFDETYASNVDENTIKPVGSPNFTQKYFLDQLERSLSVRGMDETSYVTVDELIKLMNQQIQSNTCKGKGIVMACGCIPSPLFSGSIDDLLPKWIDNGGSLYWTGNELGKMISNNQQTIEINAANILTGVPDITFSSFDRTKDTSILRNELSLQSFDLVYSAKGAGVKHFGYYNGEYSTVSCIGKGLGQICILAGTFNLDVAKDMSHVICSGLSYNTILLDYDDAIYTDIAKGEMPMPDSHGNLSLYIYVGGIHTIYGDRHDL